MSRSIAFFVSSHGYGHASRACAVMDAMSELDRNVHFEIITEVPAWFFKNSLSSSFSIHSLCTDVGVAQTSALAEDLDATLLQLETFIPFQPGQLDNIAQILHKLQVSQVICDISTLGLAAAQTAKLPSILVENFTWDWIYEGYLAERPAFKSYIPLFGDWVKTANIHIQTEPVCSRRISADLTAPPISRKVRFNREETRRSLGIPDSRPVIILSMGGMQETLTFLDYLAEMKQFTFIIPGGSQALKIEGNLVLIPHNSVYYHPDLIAASDAVVAKAGYSTIAEVYYAGIPYAYVTRERFRESEAIRPFLETNIPGFEIPGSIFQSGAWIDRIPELLTLPHITRMHANGADFVARFILDHFGKIQLH
jgi:hypothetical protein